MHFRTASAERDADTSRVSPAGTETRSEMTSGAHGATSHAVRSCGSSWDAVTATVQPQLPRMAHCRSEVASAWQAAGGAGEALGQGGRVPKVMASRA